MIELKGTESERAREQADPRSQFFIYADQGVELKPGDEVVILVTSSPEQRREHYGFAVRITAKDEPEENEIIIQYGDKLFVAQKMPEFI